MSANKWVMQINNGRGRYFSESHWDIDHGLFFQRRRLPIAVYRLPVYTAGMIESFRSKDTQALFEGKRVKRFVNFEAVAQRKLQQLDSAATLDFLRSPPGNRLEALSGDRAGQQSIRINDQFRICFVWKDGNASDVEIVDYHA